MIVICEECGKKYRIDPSKIKGKAASFKCRVCTHVIMVTKPEADSPPAPEPSVVPTAPADAEPEQGQQPPPAPEPTRVVLEFEATGNINPNSEGRASPLVVRIYRLKSYSVFEDADFFSLYEKADDALGGELIDKEEILLNPN